MKKIIVDVVAPGSNLSFAEFEKAQEILSPFGFHFRVPRGLLKPHLYLANSDEQRFKFLEKALVSADSEIIWCLRGGYGSLRLLPYLEKMKRPKKQKLLVGISDITSIHSFLNDRWGWVSLHGTLLDRIGKERVTSEDLANLVQVLRGEKTQIKYKLTALNTQARKVHRVQGFLRGGNLTTFQSLLGTPSEPSLKGSIVFFEELNEKAYRIDRILQHLHQTKILRGVRAVVFGQFTQCQEADGKEIWSQTLSEWACEQKFPVFTGLPCGHDEEQKPIFLNSMTQIHDCVLLNYPTKLGAGKSAIKRIK